MRNQPKELFDTRIEDEFKDRIKDKEIALFLDYDGTLTPIVNDPAAATLAPEMREVLRRLASRYKVALVSGRDLNTLRNFVQLNEVYYAGSHGFDIAGPENMRKRNQQGEQCRDLLNMAEQELKQQLKTIEGCEIENKAFAVAIHYRNVKQEKEIGRIDRIVDEIAGKYSKLRRGGGKKVFELQPDVEWDKGKAVLWLLQTLGLEKKNIVPVYIGDDLTDENAFQALAGIGIGIYVGELDRPTAAGYRLENVEQVKNFLKQLT